MVIRERVGGATRRAFRFNLSQIIGVGSDADSLPSRDSSLKSLAKRVTSAAAPTIRVKRGTTSSTLSRAQKAMSASSPGGPYKRAFNPCSGLGNASARSLAASAAVGGRPTELGDDPAGAVRIVEGERALVARADDRDVSPRARRSPPGRRGLSRLPRNDLVAGLRGRARIVRVPFVVERISGSSRGSSHRTRGARRRRRSPRSCSRPARRPRSPSPSAAFVARASSIPSAAEDPRPAGIASALRDPLERGAARRRPDDDAPIGAAAASAGVKATWTRT